VLATSTDESVARFEFNQVKNVSATPWNQKKLTSVPKAAAKKVTNSILGKMLQGVRKKPFVDKLNSLDLVATCGFKAFCVKYFALPTAIEPESRFLGMP